MPKIFALSDMHLSFSSQKPMNVFGSRWDNYEQRMFEKWQNTVGQDDVVLMPGDISWATYLKDAVEDFKYIDNLNGAKVISKGNHDYWWETMSKLNGFLTSNDFKSVRFLHNTLEIFGSVAVCGTKGFPETEHEPENDDERKIYNRELLRLENAIDSAKKTGAKKIIVMLHYPPGANSAFARAMQNEKVDFCVFGHLHGNFFSNAVQGNVRGVEYRLVSCDYLKFMPIKICEF